MTVDDNDKADNGVNVQALLDAREVLKGAPEAAQFTWRAPPSGRTASTARRRSRTSSASAQEQHHKTESVFDADHPEVFAAEDNGITPIEYLLVGLAGCLTAGVASVAQNRGIQLRSVEATVEGDHDIRGILGADRDVRNGFNDIKVKFKIDADASTQEIEALVAQSQKRSAVFDALDEPDERHRRGRLSGRSSSSASPPSSSAPATPASPRATTSPSGRSTTSSSNAARSRTPGGPSAGTRCGC